MQHSAEIRWFHRGVVSDATMGWFRDGQTLEAERRTDRYFSFPGCEAGGVKLRSYGDKRNFEIKLARGAAEPLVLTAGVSARTDCWVKWSYGEVAGHALVAELMQATAGFIDVDKTRYLRKFSMDAGSPVEVDPKERPDTGCNLELTALGVGGEEWWTFALESFGAPETVRATVATVAQAFLRARQPLDRFTTANSCSYPAWLAAFG